MEKFYKNITGALLLLLCLSAGCCLLTGCSQSNYMGTDMAEPTSSARPDFDSIVAENKTYGLSLPNAEKFRDILKDFIYWEYATTIEKDEPGHIMNYLKEAGFPETEVKIRLYYRECDHSDYDELESNFYEIIAVAPDYKVLSDFTFTYTARGISSNYECNYGVLADEDENEIETADASSQEIEKNISSWHTFFGETSITLNESEAKSYKVKNKFPAGEKEEILSLIQQIIKKNYKEEKDTIIYIEDFLPASHRISGRVIDLNITDKYDMPLYWINSPLHYTGKKMEDFEGIYWDTHYSTNYSGASPEYHPTIKKVKKWAQEERDAVDISKCILAYHIKDGKMIDLKQQTQLSDTK